MNLPSLIYFRRTLTWRRRRPPARFVDPPSRSPRIAYIMNLFPNLTETFVYREIDSLRAQGADILTFSIRRPDEHQVSREARRYFAETHYVLPLSLWGTLASHLHALAARPVRYLRILGSVASGTHQRWRDRLRSLCHFIEAIALIPIIRASGVEHLHAHFAVGSATCAWVLSRYLDLPFSFTAHAYDIWRDVLLLPEKMSDARFVVTCTEENRRHLREICAAANTPIRVVHHGVDWARFLCPTRPVRERPRILSVGRLCEQKGYATLLQACALLRRTHWRFECVIVGEGPLEPELRRLVRELDLEADVQLAGRVFQEEIPAFYAAADIFALACTRAPDNDRDGIPNTLMEAMASGLPVVSTCFSGIPELVVDEVTGLLVPRDDPQALASALRRLLRDELLRRTYGTAGRTRVMEAFSMESAASSLIECFRQARSEPAAISVSSSVEVNPA